jgi:hypothetical protein
LGIVTGRKNGFSISEKAQQIRPVLNDDNIWVMLFQKGLQLGHRVGIGAFAALHPERVLELGGVLAIFALDGPETAAGVRLCKGPRFQQLMGTVPQAM